MLMLRGGRSANDSHDPAGVNRTFMVCDPTERSENTSPDEPVIVKLCVLAIYNRVNTWSVT